MPTTSTQGGSGEKRKADGHISDLADMEPEKKTPKSDQEKPAAKEEVEEEDMFSDVEIINVSEDKGKSIEIVTINDTILESPEKSDESKENSDHAGSLKDDILTKIEPKDDSSILQYDEENTVTKTTPDLEEPNDDSDILAEENSSMKESSTEDAGKLDVNLDNANATSTPDQGRLRQANLLGQKDTSSEDSQVHIASQNETLKMSSPPEKSASQEIAESFKTPQENETGLVIVIMKPSEFKKLSDSTKIDDHFFLPQKKIPQDFSLRLKKMINNKTDLTRRLSDASGLSGSSSGYNADTSSVGTGSGSSGSNRDRLSIMPETLIEPHKVLSPLPKRLWPKKQRNTKEADIKKTSEVSGELKIKDNVKVFAKWVERTDIKFWPGIIKEQDTESEDKYIIKFDDGYEKAIKKEDVVRADALIPGKGSFDRIDPKYRNNYFNFYVCLM